MKKIVLKILDNFIKIYNSYNMKRNAVNIRNFIIRGKIYIRNYGSISIGKNFEANSGNRYNPIGGDTILRIIVEKNASLIIGNNVGISNSTIRVKEHIQIGNNVLIGGSCKIWDTDFHSLDAYERTHNDNKVLNKPIKINDNVFIGANSIILKGVEIGENSIIGAGSVVSKKIPANEIWAGNPAKFIRRIVT